MQEERKNVPKIRFKGYAEDWEQRKLGDFVVDYVEKTSVQNQFPMLTSSQQKGIVLQEDYFANRQVTTENNIGYFVLPRGYFTFRSRSDNDVFVFNRNDIIDRGIISYFYPVFTLKTADSDFFLRRINNGIQRQLSIQAEGTGQHVLSLKKFKNIVAMFPSEEEQQKIGTFFKQLDDTIALHQRKLDLLKETKKGFLQKMFPKNGAKVPEIRFPGFTEDWEQRKLGEMVKQFSIKSKKEDEYTVLSSTNSGMEIRDGRVSGTSNLGYKIVEDGDLVLSPQNLWLGNININDIGKGLVSPSYKTFKFTNINSAFLKPQLHTSKMLEEYKNSSTQGASIVRRNLELDSFYQIPMLVPTTEEQSKLGVFFESMDNTITLHQRELDSLKEMKKSLLQQMFV
ncbi:restriction endonuclease subunit S [Enterococcus faecium]|uniref:restriction endonuclease subunit S n=1 Tax=Enterococcus faecium TaxID=1352 RepID=UPI0020903ADD|nr:restriction endonuclease subunit S [Enterococcus faecium]MCO5453367.1 restriction endonuclease subunit S [Enterococcus faecium]